MKLLYVLITLAVLGALLTIGEVKAEQIIIKNECSKWVYGDPAGWPCYNRTQGASEAYRLSAWEDLKKLAKRRGIKIPRKVVLIDPEDYGSYVEFRSYKKGNTFYFAAMQPCQHINRKYGLEALRK
jgi:hypothetical protein